VWQILREAQKGGHRNFGDSELVGHLRKKPNSGPSSQKGSKSRRHTPCVYGFSDGKFYVGPKRGPFLRKRGGQILRGAQKGPNSTWGPKGTNPRGVANSTWGPKGAKSNVGPKRDQSEGRGKSNMGPKRGQSNMGSQRGQIQGAQKELVRCFLTFLMSS
jgi:hypothetical protein